MEQQLLSVARSRHSRRKTQLIGRIADAAAHAEMRLRMAIQAKALGDDC